MSTKISFRLNEILIVLNGWMVFPEEGKSLEEEGGPAINEMSERRIKYQNTEIEQLRKHSK